MGFPEQMNQVKYFKSLFWIFNQQNQDIFWNDLNIICLNLLEY